MATPTTPVDPPQAAQTPLDPAASAVESIAGAVDDARDNLDAARQDALDEARTQEQRDSINARFDALEMSLNERVQSIETAISTGNAQLAATLTGFLDRLDTRLAAMQGSTLDGGDDLIESIEEVAADAVEPAAAAAAATGDAVADAVDEAPRRVHGFLRPLWGGHKD